MVSTVSKAYTQSEFSDQLSGDRTWRMKEISDLKSAIRQADVGLRRVLLRSLVAICYAHWEGHVRFASRKYLQHVALRKFRYGQLSRQFVRNYALSKLSNLATSNSSLNDRCSLVDDILNCTDRRFVRFNNDLVSTRSNLTFKVLADICCVCDVSIAAFEKDAVFIDTLLVRRRNEIAHGEETFVEIDDLDSLPNSTMGLMRAFGNAVENHVYLETYRSA
jgi:hypothetical protein